MLQCAPMHPHEARIVAFLSKPSAYPHPAPVIDRRETHVSHVFLAGTYAYKLKKPVKFPFLDASQLSHRKRFCELELTLNRRLAPAIYLGMVPIVASHGRLTLGGRGKVVEWVVKMRRLPEHRMLDQLVAARRVTRRDMATIADRLVPFFRKAERSRAIDRYGSPDAVARLVLGNLEECKLFIGRLFSEADRIFLERAYRQYLALHEPVLARRVRERRIIDGHGDLRCENICMSDGVQIFDCVEFEPAFRGGDLANDFSFLVMDLESRGRADLARALVSRYRSRVNDPTFDAVADFYKCHRSLVRGKVRGFAWLQHPKTAAGRKIRRLSERHFQLAKAYARRFAPPRLIVVGGLIGSGKSTLARGLAERFGARWLRTDEIRLTEFAHLRTRAGRGGETFGGGLYAPQVSNMVYRRLIQRTREALRRGESVVCDGMFSRATGREELRRLASRAGASFFFIECAVPKAVALKRIAKRFAAKSDISEAQPRHYERLKAGFEPVAHLPRALQAKISDNRPPEQTLEAALATLRRAWNPAQNSP